MYGGYDVTKLSFILRASLLSFTHHSAAKCPIDSFPKPDVQSGLGRPQLLRPLEELEHTDYMCVKGAKWKLYGDYSADQFKATGATIVDGKLRILCGLKGTIAKVEVWPECRNSEIRYCNVNDTSPDVPLSSGLTKEAKDGAVAINTVLSLRCRLVALKKDSDLYTISE